VLAPATLAALQSTRAIPDRGVFYVADPISSIETRSLPTLTRSYPRRFTFYVADPISSIPDLWQQEAVRALQQGKDPPSPIQPSQPLRRSRRLRRDKCGGAGADRIGQDLHL